MCRTPSALKRLLNRRVRLMGEHKRLGEQLPGLATRLEKELRMAARRVRTIDLTCKHRVFPSLDSRLDIVIISDARPGTAPDVP